MSYYYIHTRWYIQIIFARKYSKLRMPVNTSLHLLAIMDIILTFTDVVFTAGEIQWVKFALPH